MLSRVIESLVLLSHWMKNGQRVASNGSPVMVNLRSGLTVAPGWINVDGSLNALVSWPYSWGMAYPTWARM